MFALGALHVITASVLLNAHLALGTLQQQQSPLNSSTTVAFSALTLLVGHQEWHPACKNLVVGCWRGYLSEARYRLAYSLADATATDCLLLQ